MVPRLPLVFAAFPENSHKPHMAFRQAVADLRLSKLAQYGPAKLPLAQSAKRRCFNSPPEKFLPVMDPSRPGTPVAPGCADKSAHPVCSALKTSRFPAYPLGQPLLPDHLELGTRSGTPIAPWLVPLAISIRALSMFFYDRYLQAPGAKSPHASCSKRAPMPRPQPHSTFKPTTICRRNARTSP